MIHSGLPSGIENAPDKIARNKNTTKPRDSVKRLSKALSDVKNTLHSHCSNTSKKKNSQSKGGNDVKFKIHSDSNKKCSSKNRLKHELKEAEGEFDFETHNHAACEDANKIDDSDFLDKYRLTSKEMNRLGDRFRILSLHLPPISLDYEYPPEIYVDDKVFKKTLSDNIIDKDFSLSIPPPSEL